MSPTQISELKRRVDEALDAGQLTDEARAALIEVLTPDPMGQTWPDVEVVLYVAEHPVVADISSAERLPEDLEKALVEAFSAVLPLLGTRAFGPLTNFVERARKRLDAERRKYEMVADYVARQDDDAAATRLLRNYLSTRPAPLFVARLRQRFPRWLAEAERQRDAGVDLAALTADQALVEALKHPAQADPAQVAAKLAALGENPEISTVTLQRALSAGSETHKLVAAAVATAQERADFAPDLIALVVTGAAHAAQLAVMAGRLAPLMARQAFAHLLADAAWQNPEEPEAKITAERSHAILSARCLLPKIGSPLQLVDGAALPESVDDPELRAIPGVVEASWALWEALDRD